MYVRGYLQGSENVPSSYDCLLLLVTPLLLVTSFTSGYPITTGYLFYFWLPHYYWLPLLLLVTPLLLVTSFTSGYPLGILKLFIYSFNKLNAFTYFFYHNCSVLFLFIFLLFYFYIQASILISINNITGFFYRFLISVLPLSIQLSRGGSHKPALHRHIFVSVSN